MIKSVVVTGVSEGLGRALALEFLKHGVKVIGCARNCEKLTILKHSNLILNNVDVSDSNAMADWANSIINDHGSPDMLIQSAGIINAPSPIESINLKTIHTIMDINFMGVVHGIKFFLPSMKANTQGIIINISSSWGKEAQANLAPYCASKFAIEGLVDAVSKELPEFVKIYALDPGDGIQTQMLHKCLPAYYPKAPTAENWAICAYNQLKKIWKKPPATCSITVDLTEINK